VFGTCRLGGMGWKKLSCEIESIEVENPKIPVE